jgi:hypothetical protein
MAAPRTSRAALAAQSNLLPSHCCGSSSKSLSMPAQRVDAVARFLEFLRLRTISREGPNGSYQQV